MYFLDWIKLAVNWRVIFYDQLTGLYRREIFQIVLPRFLDGIFRQSGRATAVFVDLNGLKAVNDTLGHEAGDRLIADAAAAIKAVARLSSGGWFRRRRADLLCRWGGDEFVAVIDGDETAAAIFVERIKKEAAKQTISLACGLAPIEANGFEAALREADMRMYEAKKASAKGRD